MLTTQTIKTWSLIHKWTSLICMAFLLLLCLTGLPLIFSEEITHWFGDVVEPPELAADTPQVSLDRIVDAAKARRPGECIRFVVPDDDSPAWFVSMGVTPGAEEASAVFMFDGRTGEFLHDPTRGRGAVMAVITRLHVDLFAGLACSAGYAGAAPHTMSATTFEGEPASILHASGGVDGRVLPLTRAPPLPLLRTRFAVCGKMERGEGTPSPGV